MMPKTEDKDLLYLVTDLETTGSNEKTDVILEVGAVLVNANLEEMWRGSWVCQDPDDKLATANDVVREMHAVNGLADDVRRLDVAKPLINVEAEAISVLQTFGKKHDFVLAGSGVAHFDRRFLDEYMTRFIKWFRYYSIDVGVMRRVLRLVGREDLLLPMSQENKTHRALGDALLHLEELRHIKKALS